MHFFGKFDSLLSLTVVVYLLLMAIGIYFLEQAEQSRYESELRSDAVMHLSLVRARLEETLAQDIAVSRSVAGIVPILPEMNQRRFELLAEGLLQQQHHVRNLGLAEGTVLRYMYPLEGNSAAVGLDFTTNEEQWPSVKRAIDSRKTIVAGPVELVQGGVAIIARTAIFEPESDEFLGLISVVIDNVELFEDIGLMKDKDFRIAIRGKDALGARGDKFFGEIEIFDQNPIQLDVALPEGSWKIACIPVGGWEMPSPVRERYRVLASIATLIVLFFIILQVKILKARNKALSELRTLSGLLPICAHCEKVRDDLGDWSQIESYVKAHSEADFSHGVCPECMDLHYGDLLKKSTPKSQQ